MFAASFTHIHNNYTTPTFKDIQLPFNLTPVEVPDLDYFPYQNYRTNIVLLRLSGEKEKRRKECAFVKKILAADKSFIFFIIKPFRFENGVNLSWVDKQIGKIRATRKGVELIDLDAWLEKHPKATFDETFKSLQQVISWLCTVYTL